ncbi:HNH endonuclease [Halobellus marinus]|uniref:HNH endonuclease n=1 Tax=Halobellus sp. GCM10025813 TaxID=3252665 RepID=UPI003609668B
MGGRRVAIACDNCGKTDTYPAHQADTRRFCSIECKAEWQSEHVIGENHPNWKEDKGEFVCDNCGEENRRKPSEIGDLKFCDVECKAEWQSENVAGQNHPNNTRELVECTWCGNDVARPRWQREQYDRHFCDDECRWAYFSEHGDEIGRPPDKMQFYCDYCGDINERIPAEVKGYDRNFCDRDCRAKWFSENQTGEDHPNWKGGVGDYYGENWKRQRRKVRKRDDYECWFCGVKDSASKAIHGAELHVHHVRRKGEFDSIEESNSLPNLLTVCAFCHQRIF